MDLKVLFEKFMEQVLNGNIEVYNEFSLQHEMGIFLREKLPAYKVQFERNTKFFGITGTIKHEIDIVIYNDYEKHAIELKYPVNGQYPEQMYAFVKDIKFMEELKEAGFDSTYCLTLVQDKNFYSGKKTDGIYSYFRTNTPITGTIVKPTGGKYEEFVINGSYDLLWNGEGENKYYIVRL